MSELPNGWETVKIPDVCELNPRKPEAGTIKGDTQVTFVPMAAVDAGSGRITTPIIRRYAEVSKGFTAFQDNDVILAKITPCMENGKAAIAKRLRNGIGFGSTEFHVFRANEALLPEYLFYFIRQDSFRKNAEANMTGSVGQKRVPVDFLKDTFLPLPPLNEQRRIVAKLEKLLSRVDAAQARLTKIPLILKRFRQSVLAAACTGRLTADWRQENTDTRTAEEIVNSLFAQRIAKAETAVKKEKINTLYQNIEEQDSEGLPEGWKFVVLNKLCESFDYGTSTKSQPSGLVPVLRMGNVQDGEIDWSELVYTSDKDEIAKYTLKPQTVLFNRTNSPELVGKTALYRGERPAIFAGYLIRVNNSNVLNSSYLNYCLNTNYAKEFSLRVKTDGVSQSNINAQKLAGFEVPFCSLEEQQEIVRRVEALFKTADAIESRYKKAKTHLDKLTQSILTQAFRGKLVSQDTTDETANILLERIQRESPVESKKKRGRFHLSTKVHRG